MTARDDATDPNVAIRDLLRAARGERQDGSPEEPPPALSPEPTGRPGRIGSGPGGTEAVLPGIGRDPSHPRPADLSEELRAALSRRRGGGRV